MNRETVTEFIASCGIGCAATFMLVNLASYYYNHAVEDMQLQDQIQVQQQELDYYKLQHMKELEAAKLQNCQQ